MASEGDRLLTGTEVAELFRVDRRTVTKWARDGRLKSMRTPGGQLRYLQSDVRAFLRENTTEADGGDEPHGP